MISPATGVSTVANGAVVFTVTDATIENLTFTATDVTDGTVLTSTDTASFVSPPAVSGGIGAAPGTIPADGTTSATVTVTLLDTQGRGASNKRVTLAQGSGRSRISASTPATSDINGQITFTVTDLFTETVVYSAVDVTDGNLPIPASSAVNFTVGAPQNCIPLQPVASAGYAVSSFASSFAYGVFGSCHGVAGIAFDPSGNVFVVNESDGHLYKFSAGGGAANAGTRVTSTPYPIAWCVSCRLPGQ